MAGVDADEYVQLSIPEVFVYKVPPRTSAEGHKAADWKEQVWVGKLVVVTSDAGCKVKLIKNDKLFACAPVRRDGPPAVEKVSDSSRYFCLRIENDKGNHAFIGVGFNSRSDAFDFNVALQDWQKQAELDAEPSAALSKLDIGSGGEDFSLKAGERINIKVPIKHGDAGREPAAARPAVQLGGAGGAGKLLLRPPGGSGAAAPAPAAAPARRAGGDDLLGLGGAAASSPAPAAAAPAGEWVTF